MKMMKKVLDSQQLVVEETLFHVANGYLGVRGCFEEGYPEGVPTIHGCYINGFYDNVALNYPEKLCGFAENVQRMVNLPDVQTLRMWLGDEMFSPFEGELLDYERTLDTENGLTARRMHWRSPGGKTVTVTIVRMASFTRPELFFTSYEVESADYEGEIRFESVVNCRVSNFHDPNDPRVAADQQQHIFFNEAEISDEEALARCNTGASGLALAVCQRMRLEGGRVNYCVDEAGFTALASAAVAPGGVARLERYTVLSDSRRQGDPAAHARAVAKKCSQDGAAMLLCEQRDYLDGFWKVSRVDIQGCPDIAESIEFSLYQLLQSAGRDSISNVPAKGLSGEGYEGHYFWDTEIYILPFFLFTQPDIARLLLDFRYSILDGARRHAKIMGHVRGALYPWRTITGDECSAYFPSGSAQYHISGDVAHSFMQYWYATGDCGYMAQKGAEVLLETARLWLEVGHYDRQGRFCIADVTGPDEYTCIVNNNYYTNQVARCNLLGAVEVYHALAEKDLHQPVGEKIGFDENELAAFEKAALAMRLPYDEALDIHAQDDSFLDKPAWDIAKIPREHFPLLLHYHPLYLYRHQICKQADTVLSHCLFDEDVAESTLRNSYDYYEKITTHDSSLSGCAFSIMASRLGLSQKAYDYYEYTVRTDLDNAHGNTKDGLHIANLGGTWLAMAAGFAGLRLRAGGLHFSFALPNALQGYAFRVWYKGSLLRLQVCREAAEICLQQGDAVTVYVDGCACRIETTARLEGVVK